MNDIVIRKATLEDCEIIPIVKLKVWETTYRGIYPTSKFDEYDIIKQKNKFKDIIINPNLNLYVALDQDNIIGYMCEGNSLFPFQDYKQELILLYILKEYQGKGIGKKFFRIAYESIKSRGYNKFLVSCNKYNYESQKFYERMGGKIIQVDEDNIDKSIPQVKFHYDIS